MFKTDFMEIQEALKIMRALADGVDPVTAETFQPDSLYRNPQCVCAFHKAVGALEYAQERERTRQLLPQNAGKPWTREEEQKICDALRPGDEFSGNREDPQSDGGIHCRETGEAGKDQCASTSGKSRLGPHEIFSWCFLCCLMRSDCDVCPCDCFGASGGNRFPIPAYKASRSRQAA